MFALAFLASVSLVWVRLKELGKPSDWAYEMILGAIVGGLVGVGCEDAFDLDVCAVDLFERFEMKRSGKTRADDTGSNCFLIHLALSSSRTKDFHFVEISSCLTQEACVATG